MVFRIEVISKVIQTKGKQWLKIIEALGFIEKIESVEAVDVYTVDKKFSAKEITKISSSLINKFSEKYVIKRVGRKQKMDLKFNFAVEIGFLPGVTDNVGNTVKECIEDLLKIKFNINEGVYSSKLVFITGKFSNQEIKEVGENLINTLIQRVHIKDFEQFKKDYGMDFIVPKVNLTNSNTSPVVLEVNLNVSDDQLIKIGKLGIENIDKTRSGPLALDLFYLKKIQEYFQQLGRNPTDIELESIAQTWSEHCKHTIFADPIDEIKEGLYKCFIKRATEEIRKQKGKKDFCVSVFNDNSGAIVFDNDYYVTHKVETHNSPSALDPFGGAITGIVGVNRDTIGFGMGAKPIANIYGFCLSNPKDKRVFFKDSSLKQKLLSTKRIMDGVIAGINVGGNTSGISTPQGFIYFDDSFRAKPLVFAGTIGLIPKKVQGKYSYQKMAKNGDYIVMVGGRVGLDGIHGATFSSTILDSGSPATAVQIGDPITQKKLSDAIVKEARDQGLYSSITDNGAGGLSCSVSEMAKESGGAKVYLENVPLKYAGLLPWQIWISESQERMTLAIPKKKWKKFALLMAKRGVEATIIGEFTNSGKCEVYYNKKIIVDLDLNFLHEGLPKRLLVTKQPKIVLKKSKIKQITNFTKVFLKVLSSPNICSFEFISSQYDYEVQASSVLKPLHGKGRVNTDTTVIRPVLTSSKGIVMSQGINPRYGEIDPYQMATNAIDVAVRNLVAAGADPDYIAILDNFCWCSSLKPERLWQLKKALEGCFDLAKEYGTPFISGKDSMFNDFSGYDSKGKSVKMSVLPTLLISAIGVMQDVSKAVSIDAKSIGDLVYITGETFEELGGSEYYNVYKYIGLNIPKVDSKKNKKLYESYFKCVQKELVNSAVSIHKGGLAIALAKTSLSGMLGIDISLKNLPGEFNRSDVALFSESAGRILVTVSSKNKTAFEKHFKGLPVMCIGRIIEEPLIKIKDNKEREIINVTLSKVLKSYKNTFKDY